MGTQRQSRRPGSVGEKTLNILANETPTGTHLFAIVGTDLRQHIEFGETELVRKVSEMRDALQWVCGDPIKGDSYRYEPANRGDSSGFTKSMAGLAELGYDLYVDFVTGQDQDFEARLAARLAGKATIQVARMKSAKHTFPWSLVYDHPFVLHSSNRMCPDFLAALAGTPTAEELSQEQCFSAGCANRDDTNVICPSGSWGFRHIIEQPLSPISDAVIPAGLAEAADTIPAAPQLHVLLAYSRNLRRYGNHLRDVSALLGAAVEGFGRCSTSVGQ